MKLSKFLILLVFSSVVSFYGCKDESKEPVTDTPTQQNTDPQPIDFNKTPSQTTAQSGQNAQGVYHYTCNNGCAGGAAAAGNCGTCGNKLAHNQAYHSNQNDTTNTADPFNQNTTTTNSGQNAAGVWHYTCSNGCAGGAGAAGNCGSCGNALAHNQAYHL